MATYLQSKNPVLTQKSMIPISTESVVLGRHPCCDVVLKQGAASREHARIAHHKDGYYIEDLQSRNGTLLNNRPVTGTQKLYNNDVIRICNIEFVFCSDSQEAVREPLRESSICGQTVIFHEDHFSDHPLNITSQMKVHPSQAESLIRQQQRDLNREIRNLENKLRVMMDFARNLGKVGESRELLPRFQTNLLRLYPQADSVCILVPNKTTHQFEMYSYKRRDENSTEAFRISRSIIEKVVQTKTGILSDDVPQDSRFDASESILHYQICSAMAVPILDSTNDDLLGIIQVDARHSGKPFTPDDLDLLISIANQMAVYQENLKYQDVQIQRKMMSQEMNVAHKVQKGFLPAEPPQIPGFEFYDYYQPAKFLGGDYFDYVPLGNGLLAVALGDVSGKGISASLLMAKLSSEVRYSLLLEKSLPKTMEHLNRVYSENHWGDRFITFILLVIDLKTREIHLCNAGHVYPILSKTNGEIMEIGVDRNGFPLGIVPDAQYEEIIFTLEDGELVSLMSDGITDATNAQGENYGIQRVYERLANHDGIGAGEMGQRLISSVREFAGQMPQADDQCLVIFGRTTNSGDTDETENSLS